MSDVDWSKAPGWADRLMESPVSGKKCWANDVRYRYSCSGIGFLGSPPSNFKVVSTRITDEWQEGEKRMNNIAQNGNDGHYERKVVEHDKKNKYSRKIKTISLGNVDHAIYADVYDVLTAFEVVNPAMAHAVKKMLAPGQRGAKGTIQDMKEAVESIERAIELELEK